MNWLKIRIGVLKPGIDFVSDIFEQAGISSLEIEDNEEFLETLEQTKAGWNFIEDELFQEKSEACSVSGYVTDNQNGRKTLDFIENEINNYKKNTDINNYGSLDIFVSAINEDDWAHSWKKYFKPIPVGENILICPVWEEIPEEYKSRHIFKIDPGMSFGTGTHETTRLCVAALEKYIKRGDSVLDIGCGSGILSITAMILGAESAVAVDIDENCVRIAGDNAKTNFITQNYKVYAGDLLTDKKLREKISKAKYNIILMNIVPGVIIPLLPLVKNLLAQGGTAILSGIIGIYSEDIENAVESYGLKIIGETSENDWRCVIVTEK